MKDIVKAKVQEQVQEQEEEVIVSIPRLLVIVEMMSFSSFVSVGPVSINTGVTRALNSTTINSATNGGDIAPTSGLTWNSSGLQVAKTGAYFIACQISFIIVKPSADPFVAYYLEMLDNSDSTFKIRNQALTFRVGNTEECVNFEQVKHLIAGHQYIFQFRLGSAPNSQYYIQDSACFLSVQSVLIEN